MSSLTLLPELAWHRIQLEVPQGVTDIRLNDCRWFQGALLQDSLRTNDWHKQPKQFQDVREDRDDHLQQMVPQDRTNEPAGQPRNPKFTNHEKDVYKLIN
jgi:hypothetical protein